MASRWLRIAQPLCVAEHRNAFFLERVAHSKLRLLPVMTALWLTFAVAALLHATVAQSPRQGVACNSIGNAWHAISQQCLCAPCHLCEFSFMKWKCEFIMQDDTSLSDGSDASVEQPELKAEAWFLTDEEMVESRNGVQRNGLKPWSVGNTVTTYAATNEFYDEVYADLEATKANDHVWITGWTFDDVVLKPQVDPKDLNETKVVALLQRLAEKKVDFHILAWTNLFESSQNVAAQAAINAIKPGPLDGEAYFIFDDRLTDITSSHHQKTITIKRPQGIVAYVGGVDLTWDRWDTLQHDQAELRKRADIERDGGSDGWMDAHLKIDGPAATDVGNSFLQRWNAAKTPLEDLLDNVFPFENPAYSDLNDLKQGQPLVEQTNGHHAVQIVRTYSCNYEHYEEFAPHGEASIFHARLKALKLAKNYVYIEDQYFIHVPELLQALLDVLPKLQRVIIVTQPASSSTSKAGYLKYQFEMITPLQQRFPNKVQVYRTKPERGVYIHSKLVIIDDVFLSIGSSNWNRRSMTTDTEIAANVVDNETVKTPDGIEVNKLARDYRIRKFMELSGKSYEELNGMKFLDAANALDTAALKTDTVLAPYQVQEDATFAAYPDVVQDLLDPPYECSSK